MKRPIIALAIGLASLPLTACMDNGYGSGSLYWSSYPYNGWYDNHYGPIYDGYWGTDNYFYYRRQSQDRRYYRDRQQHFRRGERSPGGNFRRFEGTNQQPPQGTRMPNFPSGDRPARGHGRGGRNP